MSMGFRPALFIGALLACCAGQAAGQDDPRSRALGLITLNADRMPLGDVVKSLKSQTGMNFRIDRGVDASTPVTLTAANTPFHQFFQDLCEKAGCDWMHETVLETGAEIWVLEGKWKSRPAWSITEGGALSFPARAYKNGYVVSIQASEIHGAHLQGRIERIVDRQGVELPLERCEKCTDIVFVKAAALKDVNVTFSGQRIWKSVSTFDVADPSKGQEFTEGDCRIRYAYPKVTVTSSRPMPELTFPDARLEGVLKSDGSTLAWLPKRPTSFLSYPRRVKSWCSCAEGPDRTKKEPAAVAEQEFTSADYPSHKPEDFKSLRVVFLRRIAEPLAIDGTVILP